MSKADLAAPCGLYCGQCEELGRACMGCGAVQGKPFWTEALGVPVCPIFDCCRDEKELEHCGCCARMPCQTFQTLRDPALTDEAFAQSLHHRQQALLRRKALGTARWLAELIAKGKR